MYATKPPASHHQTQSDCDVGVRRAASILRQHWLSIRGNISAIQLGFCRKRS
jgi:hypothetical protein